MGLLLRDSTHNNEEEKVIFKTCTTVHQVLKTVLRNPRFFSVTFKISVALLQTTLAVLHSVPRCSVVSDSLRPQGL